MKSKLLVYMLVISQIITACGISNIEKNSETIESESVTNQTEFIDSEVVTEGETVTELESEVLEEENKKEPEQNVTKPQPENENTNTKPSDSQATALSETDKKLKAIVDEITTPTMSEFEKALRIHDWLVFHVDYDRTYSNYTIEAMLATRYVVCQGYAQAYQKMCKCAGLEAICVTGTATNSNGESGGHMWNQVKIDGAWYNVDVTWDDPTWDDYEGPKQFDDHSQNAYRYFLVSDEVMNYSHVANCSKYDCPQNYNRSEILKYGAENSWHENVIYVESKEQLLVAVEKYMEQELEYFRVWTSESYQEETLANWLDSSVYYTEIWGWWNIGGSIDYTVNIDPMSRWNEMPIVKSREEFDAVYEEIKTREPGVYGIRYENAEEELDITGIETLSYNGGKYFDGRYWFIPIYVN